MNQPRIRLVEDDQLAPARSSFLTVQEAANFLRLSAVTLCRWRIEGAGPSYCKFGRRVVYERSDLIAWGQAQKRSSTSEAKGQS